MKKFYLLIILTVITTLKSFSQTPDTLICDAPDRDTTEAKLLPWFGNNQYLENFLDSIGYNSSANRIVGPDQVRYHVPIKFWVYRNSAGIGGPDIQDLRNYIDNLNRFFNVDNDVEIGFYMKCEIGFIDNNDHLVINNDLEAWNLIQNHKERGCINVHITNTLNGATGVHYRARFFGIDAIFLNRSTYTSPELASTLSHEVGHYFELDHTHQVSGPGWPSCWSEPIDRNRTWPIYNGCNNFGGIRMSHTTGDFLEDTPADHNLSSNFSCNYTITGRTDLWGDRYESPPAGSLSPDPGNIMSYNGLRQCRVIFSRLQIAVMLHSIERGKSKNNRNAWKDARAEYDEYEMDNFSETARNIPFGEIQERNFHQQYNETGLVWSQCDIDWARFTPTCSGTFNIETSSMQGRTNANTRLTLFNNALTELVQNDNISGTNLYSRISWNFVAGQAYFIRIENMSNLVTGYYRLQAGIISLAGNTNLCQPAVFTVTKPANATVTWSATPVGIVNFNPVGPTTNATTTVTRITNGNTTIRATIGGCGTPVALTLPVVVGPPAEPAIVVYGIAPHPLTQIDVEVITDAPPPYNWYVDGALVYTTSNKGPYTINGGGCGSHQLRVDVSNGCGANSATTLYNRSCSGFRVSPNPATNTINITTNNETSKSSTDKNTSSFIAIEIFDKSANLKRKLQYAKGTKSATIDITNLPVDMYVVRIYSGSNSWEDHKILVNK